MLNNYIFLLNIDRLRQKNGFKTLRTPPLQLASMLRQLLGMLPTAFRQLLNRLPTMLIQLLDSMPRQLLDRLRTMPIQLLGRLLSMLMQQLTQLDRLLKKTKKKLLVFSNRFLPDTNIYIPINLECVIVKSIYIYLFVADWRASEEHGSWGCGDREAHPWNGQEVKLANFDSFVKVVLLYLQSKWKSIK